MYLYKDASEAVREKKHVPVVLAMSKTMKSVSVFFFYILHYKLETGLPDLLTVEIPNLLGIYNCEPRFVFRRSGCFSPQCFKYKIHR